MLRRNSQADEQLALKPPVSVAAAMEYFINTKLKKALDAEQESVSGFSRKDKGLYTTVVLLGVVSGIVFWFSSDKAGQRYVGYAEDTSFYDDITWMVWLPPIGGMVTNIAFNTESYLTIGEVIQTQKIKPQKKKSNVFGPLRNEVDEDESLPQQASSDEILNAADAETALMGSHYKKTEWSVSVVISFFAVLPFWYASLTDDARTNALSTVSAILNLPVNTDGAKNLLDWFKGFDCKDRARDLFFSTTQLRSKNLALRKARNLIADRLHAQASAFGNLQRAETDAVRLFVLETKGNALMEENKPWRDVFESLLTYPVSLSRKSKASSCSLLYAGFGFLAVAGVWANYGYIMDINKPITPIARPMNFNHAGRKSLPSVTTILF